MSQEAGTQDNRVPPLDRELKTGVAVETSELFPDFEWKEGMEPPETLVFNEFGFPQDAEGNWYLTRSTKPMERPIADVGVGDLFNRTGHQYTKSTFGTGLYFGNQVPSVEPVSAGDLLRGRHPPRTYHVLRFNPGESPVFSATSGLRESETGGMVGKLIVRAVSAGLAPTPSKAMYDKIFGNASIAVTTPAGGIYRFRRNIEINGQVIKPKWAVVRDLSRLEVAGYRK